jgi:uncharacterized tellurite resistance protein B-like protein
MAGIFEQLIKPNEQVISMPQSSNDGDALIQELKAAKEILQEIFGAEPKDVEEMIQARIAELKGLY